MALIIIIFTAITGLVGIWLGYWGEGKPTEQEDIIKLRRNPLAELII
jgi:hypothetical protein